MLKELCLKTHDIDATDNEKSDDERQVWSWISYLSQFPSRIVQYDVDVVYINAFFFQKLKIVPSFLMREPNNILKSHGRTITSQDFRGKAKTRPRTSICPSSCYIPKVGLTRAEIDALSPGFFQQSHLYIMRLSLAILIPIVVAEYPLNPPDNNPCDLLDGDCTDNTSYCCDSLLYTLCDDLGYGGFFVLRECGTGTTCVQQGNQIVCEPST